MSATTVCGKQKQKPEQNHVALAYSVCSVCARSRGVHARVSTSRLVFGPCQPTDALVQDCFIGNKLCAFLAVEMGLDVSYGRHFLLLRRQLVLKDLLVSPGQPNLLSLQNPLLVIDGEPAPGLAPLPRHDGRGVHRVGDRRRPGPGLE